MKMLKKFNLHKNIFKMGINKKNLFTLSIQNYSSENLEIISSKVDRNSQEFQVYSLMV